MRGIKARLRIVVVATFGITLISSGLAAANGATPSQTKFFASKDTYISSIARDGVTKGELTFLRVSNDPAGTRVSFVAFDNINITKKFDSATLNLLVTVSGSPVKISEAGDFTEGKSTWNLPPTIGKTIATLPTPAVGKLLSVDVTSEIRAGKTSFAIQGTGNDIVQFGSRNGHQGATINVKYPAPPTSGLTPNMFGVSTGAALWELDAAGQDQEFARLQGIGTKWVRAQIPWKMAEPDSASDVDSHGQETAGWKRIDAMVASANKHGLQIIAQVSSAPAWTNPNSIFSNNPAVFGTFVGKLANRYFSTISVFEVGNETNLDKQYFAASALKPYLQAVDTALTTVAVGHGTTRSHFTEMPSVLAGGVQSGPDYVADLYNVGANQYFDAIGYHPYTYPALPDPNSGAWGSMVETHSKMIDQVTKRPDGKKIWITEFGAPTNGPPKSDGSDGGHFVRRGPVTKDQQAAMVTYTYKLLATEPWTGPLCWFQYQDKGSEDNPQDLRDHGNFLGLWEKDGTPKPAVATYRHATDLAAAGR